MTHPRHHPMCLAQIPLQEITDLVSKDLIANIYSIADLVFPSLGGWFTYHPQVGDQDLGLRVSLLRTGPWGAIPQGPVLSGEEQPSRGSRGARHGAGTGLTLPARTPLTPSYMHGDPS